jgi:hypothetical protein
MPSSSARRGTRRNDISQLRSSVNLRESYIVRWILAVEVERLFKGYRWICDEAGNAKMVLRGRMGLHNLFQLHCQCQCSAKLTISGCIMMASPASPVSGTNFVQFLTAWHARAPSGSLRRMSVPIGRSCSLEIHQCKRMERVQRCDEYLPFNDMWKTIFSDISRPGTRNDIVEQLDNLKPLFS